MAQTLAPGPQPQGQRTSRRDRYQPTPWSAQRFYRPYVRWSLGVALTLGFGTGAAMFFLPALGIAAGQAWVTHTQAHGVAQVFGWAGLFLMGVAYHVVPRFRNGSIAFPWPQRVVLALVLLGIALRFAGQTAPSLEISPLLLVASGVALALGVALFAAVLARALRSGTSPRTTTEAWLWMSLFWSLLAAGLHLTAVTRMAANNLAVAPYFLNAAFVHVALVGFVGNFILGISLRAIPAFMSLPSPHVKLARLALVAINAGVALSAVGWLLGVTPWAPAVSTLLQVAGFVVFVAAIRIYSRREHRRPYTLGAYGRYEWFLRAGFGWLVVAGILLGWNGLGQVWPVFGPPVTLAAPALHALALGFVTMLIMGMAARMLPLFEGAVLPFHGLMDAAFALLNLSVLLRLAFGLVPSVAAWIGLALSGSLGTLALLCFTVVVWRTFHPTSRERYAEMARAFGRQQRLHVQV